MKLLPLLLLFFVPPAYAGVPSIEGLIGLVIWLVVVGLIFALLWWFVGYVGLPQPFDKVARVLIGLIALVLLLYLLLGLIGPTPSMHFR